MKGTVDLVDVARLSIGEPPNVAEKTVVILWVTISNQGSDSIANGYKLWVKLPNGVVLQDISPTYFGSAIKFSELHFRLDVSQYLPDETSDAPIPRGGAKTGILAFTVGKTLYSEVHQKGTELELRFKDISGKDYETTYILRGIRKSYMYVPGTPRPLPLK